MCDFPRDLFRIQRTTKLQIFDEIPVFKHLKLSRTLNT